MRMLKGHAIVLRVVLTLVSAGISPGCLEGRRAWEHPSIVKRLEALDGVTVEAAAVSNGNLGGTYAVLRVRDHGLLSLAGLTLDSFEPGAQLYANQVGEHSPHWVGFGYWGVVDSAGRRTRGAASGNAIDLSAGGPFAAVLPVHGRTIQDLVNAYDEIVAALGRWPDCPTPATLLGRDGTDYRYCAQRSSKVGPQLVEGHLSEDAFARPEYPPTWDRPWESDGLTSR